MVPWASALVASYVAVSACPPGSFGVGRDLGLRKVRLASWNIGSLTGKSIELVKSLRRRKISIACVPVSYTHLTLPTKRIV